MRLFILILFSICLGIVGCGNSEEKKTTTKSENAADSANIKDQEWANKNLSKEQIDAAKKAGVPAAIEEEIAKGVTLRMVYVPPTEYDMGSPDGEIDRDSDESPAHKVTIKEGFYISVTEITQAQWKAVMGVNPSWIKDGTHGAPKDTNDYPVEFVGWDDIRGFIEKLNKKAGKEGYRLPSEAEWEYAYRAGTATRFYWGDDEGYKEIGDYAWYGKNSGGTTHQVGQKKPNKWGLYDMSGNVWERCEDDYQSSYKGAPTDGTPWVYNRVRGELRVFRGGSWGSQPRYCRAADRSRNKPKDISADLGVRIVRTINK